MERIAYIFGEHFVYWSHVTLLLAVLAAMFAFLALHLSSGGKTLGTVLALPLALSLGILLGRLVHWYCVPDSYAGFAAAMTNFGVGNYALVGVFAGVLLTLGMLRLASAIEDLPKALDCAAIAGSLGIALGRLNCLFNPYGRGQILEGIQSLPIVWPVENASTGVVEYRFATFMMQAIVAAVIFVALAVFYYLSLRNKKLRSGDACLLFCLCYGLSQVLLDSTRYDSLFFRSNGFVSMVQILGAVIAVVAIVIFSVRLVRARGWSYIYLGFWGGILLLLTAAGIMEYFVQRIGNRAVIFHSVMGVCLAGVVVITLVMRRMAVEKEDLSRVQTLIVNEEEQT